ncbi:tetratricopeptide repeat protein [Streptomyces sp. NPDC093085]|uniref:tetratricopeptide repeat protein n=1 Tax=Streptomyces sp. NPDC093085 TaxID=3155068 RepID=UPI0034249EFA
MNPMKTEQVRQVRRAALAAGVGAVLVAGVVLFVPDRDGADERTPQERALAAVSAGAPASLADLDALIQDREKWVRVHPEDASAWAVLGAAYVERGERHGDSSYYSKADQALQRSLKGQPVGAAGPEDHGARGADGTGAEGAEDTEADGTADGSGDDSKRGGAGVPARTQALAGLASLANARHDFTTAKKWAETLRARQPRAWRAYPALIDAYTGLGQYAAAGKALDKLKELRPGSPAALSRAVSVYRDRGWREDAEAKADEASTHADSPTEKAEALCALGELAWERGEPSEAMGHYDAALTALPDHPAALAGRARALAALSRTDEAYRAYQAALNRLPRPEYALELGELYDASGLDGDARTQYATLRARASRAQGDGVNEELVLGRFEADHGDPAAAVARLRAEWGRGHRSIDVADALAWALYRVGRPQEALPYAKKATDQGRRSALFLYHRAEIERSLDLYGPARRHVGDALRINPYFSPLLAPRAIDALESLGEPVEGGPRDIEGAGSTPQPAEMARPTSGAATPAPAPSGTPAPGGTPTGGGTPAAPVASEAPVPSAS